MMMSLHILLLVSATILVVTAAPGDEKNKVTADGDAEVQEAVNELINESPVAKLVDLICDCKVKEMCDSGKSARDCYDLLQEGNKKSGVYNIYPLYVKGPVQVYCDMETDGGGWTVFQRRKDGIVDFFLDWESYKSGFGVAGAEFWLGNDNIFAITSQDRYVLRVDMEDVSGVQKYAQYSPFRIGNENEKYKLAIGKYSGTAGNSLNYHNGRMFSTKDQDNDQVGTKCAETRKGAWWYYSCEHCNLNGIYKPGYDVQSTTMFWYHFNGNRKAVKSSEMKTRPVIN